MTHIAVDGVFTAIATLFFIACVYVEGILFAPIWINRAQNEGGL